MYGLRGNRAREKTALTPDPSRRSSLGCTTLDSRRMDMDVVRPRKDPWGLSPSRRALGSLGYPDGSLWSLSTCGTTSVVV